MDSPAYSPADVREILLANGVKGLHHANSVATTCQFLRHGSLISRGSIQRKGLYQTPQNSDELDQRHGIWFDLFVDSVDIHARANRANAYGPALLVFSVDLLVRMLPGQVWVTKLNPTKWDGRPAEDHWFMSKDSLTNGYIHGQFDQMIVLRHCGGEISLLPHLREIVLDDPRLRVDELDFYSASYGALRLALFQGGIDVPIRRRECRNRCVCTAWYNENIPRTSGLFSPRKLAEVPAEPVLQPA
jgi:hypothetical protein